VQKGLLDLFGVKVSCQGIVFYDPTKRSGAKRESKWTALFHATREKLRKGGAKFVARRYRHSARLTDEQKEYVVRRLAALDGASAVQKGLWEAFGVEMSCQAIQFYDPTRGAKAKRESRWTKLFRATQEELARGSANSGALCAAGNAGKLTDEQKEYVVEHLAAFDRASAVQKGLLDEFGVKIVRQSVQFYDPTKRAGMGLDEKWKTLFHATREAMRNGSAEIGAPGLSVIAGHRDTQFRALADLALGERFELELPDGSSLDYEVAAIDVVDSSSTSLRLDANESTIALVTCWPFDALAPGGALRFVVTGRAPTHW